MSANDYSAKAQSGSPGTNLAEMQARLYAGEATQRGTSFASGAHQNLLPPAEQYAVCPRRVSFLLSERLVLGGGLRL